MTAAGLIPERHYLLVDDSIEFAENLAEILRDEGHQAIVAGSGVEALKAVSRERFDAVLTDMRMPAMGGAQFVHQLRGVDPGIPALVATAYTGDEDLQIARSEGLLAILPKPLPIARLLVLLRAARRDGSVVLIEDDEALSDNLTEALRVHGLTAVAAKSILETQKLGEVRPFAAIVDLRVPGGPDGEAMIRLQARYPGLPMLVITGHDIPPPLPFVEMFRKPFDTEGLLLALEKLYRSRTA